MDRTMSDIAQTEVAPPESSKSELLVAVEQTGMEPETCKTLLGAFTPFADQVAEWKSKISAICIPGREPTKVDVDLARTSRLALVKIRTGADKQRKALKEDVNRRGKAIDGIYNFIEFAISPLESQCADVEKYFERKEQERKAALKLQREELLKPYGVDTTVYLLGDMSDDSFSSLLAGTKAEYDRKIEAAQVAERERIEAENRRLADEARIRAENERLKKEAEERAEADRLAKEKADREAKEAADRFTALKAEREVLLKPYDVDMTFLRLGDMPAQEFTILLTNSRTEFEMLEKQRADVAEKKRQEEVAAVAEKQRSSKLASERKVELAGYDHNWDHLNLGEMGDEAYISLLTKSKLAHEENLKRIAERQELEAKAKADKEAADAKASEERAAREKAEAELKAQRDAETARLAKDEAARKKAEMAPDAEKVRALAAQIRSLTGPQLTTVDGVALAVKIAAQVDKFANWLDAEATKLAPAETPEF